jgi:6-phosphogluconolactonase
MEVFVPGLNMSRITMTAQIINNAANIVFLVTGEEKAEILKKVFSESNDNGKIPARLIHPVDGKLRWMVDEAAAALVV